MNLHLSDTMSKRIADNLPGIYEKLNYIGRDSERKGVYNDNRSKLDREQLEYLTMFLADFTD